MSVVSEPTVLNSGSTTYEVTCSSGQAIGVSLVVAAADAGKLIGSYRHASILTKWELIFSPALSVNASAYTLCAA
ncbi:hypothetical protein [Actinoplanes sp. L3-i22]|uniref:hypothetical protein n=1 Tax=Actinoplanes sp. L3-i22 TaxID=2836373 RepID=UPI001C845278|nr:hypothetical protein [Actinoplanes sp. L3-i22]